MNRNIKQWLYNNNSLGLVTLPFIIDLGSVQLLQHCYECHLDGLIDLIFLFIIWHFVKYLLKIYIHHISLYSLDVHTFHKAPLRLKIWSAFLHEGHNTVTNIYGKIQTPRLKKIFFLNCRYTWLSSYSFFSHWAHVSINHTFIDQLALDLWCDQ